MTTPTEIEQQAAKAGAAAAEARQKGHIEAQRLAELEATAAGFRQQVQTLRAERARAWGLRAIADEPNRRAEADAAVVTAYAAIEAAVDEGDLQAAFRAYAAWRVARQSVNAEHYRLVRGYQAVGADDQVQRLSGAFMRPWPDGDLVDDFGKVIHELLGKRVAVARKLAEQALGQEVERAARGEAPDA